jgi:hypothetical protein
MKNQVFKKPLFREKLVFILPAFSVTFIGLLILYAEASMFSPTRIITPLIVLWSILGILTWPIQKLTKDLSTTGAVLFIFVIGFYLSTEGFYIITTSYLLGAICLIISFRILKRKLQTKHIALMANSMAFILIVILASFFILRFATVDWMSYSHAINKSKQLPIAKSHPDRKPDIYYIVLDGYGRADVLEQYYLFNNSEFKNNLRQKGFIVPKNSYANYPTTFVSVPSTLNFDYIQNFLAETQKSQVWWLVNPFWQNNKTKMFLENIGYTSISIAVNWGDSSNPNTQIHYTPTTIFLTEFDSFILAKTPLRIFQPVISKFAFVNSYDAHRQLILYNFETLEKIAEMPEPTFTIAHIIAPHPPFVFDRHGNHITPGYPFSFLDETSIPLTNAEYRTGYTEQLIFINHKLETLIDTILEKSETPPIIILQADHGPRRVTDLISFDNKCQKERFAIFAAYHLPGMEEALIPDDITPVNLFRIIFNEYFSTDLPLLEARSYTSQNADVYPFEFIDITSELDRDCPFNP